MRWATKTSSTLSLGRRTTFAYVMNMMGQGLFGSERTARYATLIYEALA
jgi:hypothetical protein